MDDCNAKGGNLPTLGQLRSIRDLPGIDLSNPDVHWADAPFQQPLTVNYAITFSDASVVASDPFATQNSFRCVYPLVR